MQKKRQGNFVGAAHKHTQDIRSNRHGFFEVVIILAFHMRGARNLAPPPARTHKLSTDLSCPCVVGTVHIPRLVPKKPAARRHFEFNASATGGISARKIMSPGLRASGPHVVPGGRPG